MQIINDLSELHLAYWEQACPDAKRIVMNKPPDMDNCDDCGAIATHTDQGLIIRVAYKPSPEDIEALIDGGTVWLSSWSGLLPHMLEVQPPPC